MSDDLETMFAAARSVRTQPSADLIARVLQDADGALVRPVPLRSKPPGFLARALAAFGGAGAFAGMATAAVAGLWIGFAQPVGEGIFASVLGSDLGTMDLMPGIDALLDEDLQ